MKYLAVPVLFMALIGCAGQFQNVEKFNLGETQKLEAASRDFLKAWPFWSGAIRADLGPRIQQLPADAIAALDQLDQLAAASDVTERQLGESVGLRLRLLADTVREALKLVAPAVLATMQGVLVF